jgi:hypothetical protein
MAQCGGNITSGFIDLATYDELEKYQYGGESAVTYFVRETRRSTWFTHVPVQLQHSNATPEFGARNFSVSISRSGDYMLYNWLRVTIPEVELTQAQADLGLRLRWTRNLMHNLVEEMFITFNDLCEFRLDNYHLDFWSAFTVPSSKRVGYNNMVGNQVELFNPLALGASAPFGVEAQKGIVIPSHTLNLPLPHCHSRDSGVALPTAALPYNEMKISFCFRHWSQLLIVDNPTAAAVGNLVSGNSRPATSTDLLNEPKLSNVEVWAAYAIVSNNERKLMGQNPRDMLIEQVQTLSSSSYMPNSNKAYDLRMSHAIKALFFGVRNSTNSAEWSNYTSASPDAFNGGNPGVVFNTSLSTDPVSHVNLAYENSQRLTKMPVDYFSLVAPFYHAVSIPEETGYHMYAYTLDIMSVDPMGSTNYGKLTNVSICAEPSADSQTSSTAPAGTAEENAANGHHVAQKFQFVLTAVNHNVVRISGGALGFPVL